jgi:hypothetical protein
MAQGPIAVIKKLTRRAGILGPAMIATAITLIIVGIIWAVHHGQIF